ncbi:MAG TPA: RluA family pseudouridine synthase [Anaeromyxobacteraceae bacterium]|nr:RluA family pseudouridine synthase [Anaeromyxobacteraceae bacterium]
MTRPGGLAVLLADAALVAVDKPPGRLVIPGRGAPERTVLDEAQERFGRLWVVHRLDRGTSGALLFARSAAAHRALSMAFEGRAVAKRYLALVRGAPPSAALLDAPIAPARRGRMRPGRPGDPRAKAAATRVRLLEAFPARGTLPALALVEAEPETGRTHQIRVHLAWAGTPLAVDPDYGEPGPLTGAGGEPLLARTPLHAASLDLVHPESGARLRVEAPLPEDMRAVLAAARGG